MSRRGTASTGGGSGPTAAGSWALPPVPQPVAGLQRGGRRPPPPRGFQARAPFRPVSPPQGSPSLRVCEQPAFCSRSPGASASLTAAPCRGGELGGSARGAIFSCGGVRWGVVVEGEAAAGAATGGREAEPRLARRHLAVCGVTGQRRCGAAEVRRGRGCSLPARPGALGWPPPFPGFIPESVKRRLDLQEWRRISWRPRRGR